MASSCLMDRAVYSFLSPGTNTTFNQNPINSTACCAWSEKLTQGGQQIHLINIFLLAYIAASVSSSLFVHVTRNSCCNNPLLKCFDARTNLLKVTSDESCPFTRIRFINSLRVFSLLTLLVLHPVHPVYKSIKMYFFSDWSLFVRHVSFTGFSVTTLVTCVNYMLSACMYTVIWIPNLRKAGGLISLISFLCVRSASRSQSALFIMLLVIRSLPNYRTGGRSIFVFIQRVTLARVINWYLKCISSHIASPTFKLFTSSDLYLYIGAYAFVRSLLWKQAITHSGANSLMIAFILMTNFSPAKITSALSLLNSVNLSDVCQLSLLFFLSNGLGILLGVLLRYHFISVKYSLHLKVTGCFFLFAGVSLASHVAFGDASFLLTVVIVFTACSALCSIGPIVYYNEASFFNRLLSSRVMSPVSKLFYSMLLAHPFVSKLLTRVDMSENEPLNLAARFLVTLATLVPGSLIINVFFEAPFYSVTRYLMYPGEKDDDKTSLMLPL